MIQPLLKIVGMHIEGLRALRRLDWPADGMGWVGGVPDMVMVGGGNGSGKTTLLETLVSLFETARDKAPPRRFPLASRCWLDLKVRTTPASPPHPIRIALGDAAFFDQMTAWLGLAFRNDGHQWFEHADHVQNLFADEHFARSDLPCVIYLPAERTLSIPDETYKAPGKVKEWPEFIHVLNPVSEWKESLEARLYGAHWEDLNARDEGRGDQADHFGAYARAFDTFFEGSKALVWRRAELVVEISDNKTMHGLSELSSGEKQVILIAGELLHRWRPGSLILIDEPEAHLHPSWQTKLWSMLARWQKERGGQVIMATQSNHLFRIAESGTKVLLGQENLG